MAPFNKLSKTPHSSFRKATPESLEATKTYEQKATDREAAKALQT
eukprot:CAMPEP_0172432914 /NCGR_PEP_ID=MMETSP1064-20121228/65558_1 /TAXON_ID=202472 /ORGANISM="Aulacoseira subarctica , Strain CCAP 1002/5" /LENGTH=44 /DNA_ID= /DNA_START= /DNA_END= /DNA_ORIENTATION=